MKRARGFSLMEAIVSVALFAMVTMLMANLMNTAAASEKFLGEKDRIHEVALSSLYRMAHEARTANRWITPTRGTSNEMLFETPDLLLESREFPPAKPYPTSWTPGNPKYQVTVHYFIDTASAELRRTLTAGSQSWTGTVVHSCQALEVKRLGAVNLTISLTVITGRSPKTSTVQVMLPQESWEPQ